MEIKPTPFELHASEWWVKPLAMLEHNWAVVNDGLDSVTVYFFTTGRRRKTLQVLHSEEKIRKSILLSWTPWVFQVAVKHRLRWRRTGLGKSKQWMISLQLVNRRELCSMRGIVSLGFTRNKAIGYIKLRRNLYWIDLYFIRSSDANIRTFWI